jgi:cell wall-associated NlpC family hydrolase
VSLPRQPEFAKQFPIVTDVEHFSTAPSGKRTETSRARSALRAAVLTGVVVTVLSSSPWPRRASGGADSLSGARAQAAQINAELQTDAQKVDELSQSYDTALQIGAPDDASLSRTKAAIAQDSRLVASTAGTSATTPSTPTCPGATPALQSMFGGTGEQTVVTDEYRSVASENISAAVDTLDAAESRLSTEQSKLQSTQAQANAALAQAEHQPPAGRGHGGRPGGDPVRGHGPDRHPGGPAAGPSRRPSSPPSKSGWRPQPRPPKAAGPSRAPTHRGAARPLPIVPASGGAATAVAAAESQIGVPYHWGGEVPGVGFDCSGLTQWAWGRAGVGIPRTAQEQYDAIEHVSLAALEPGDLIFWGSGSGGITHVGMYVGGGNVIHAPETGETVRIQPIWNSGLVGAGRP